MPRVITGGLHFHNRNAIDWGFQSVVAFGCQSFVVLLNVDTMTSLRVLQGHRRNVVKVKWAPSLLSYESYCHVEGEAFPHLASADVSGEVIVWDVLCGEPKAAFHNEPVGSQVRDLQWFPWQNSGMDLLAVLHTPDCLVLWNAEQGTQIWKKSFGESLVAFCFDPFSVSRAAFLTATGGGDLMLVDDISIFKVPSSCQFYKMSAHAGEGVAVMATDGQRLSATRKSLSIYLKNPLTKALASAVSPSASSSFSDADAVNADDRLSAELLEGERAEDGALQIVYHPAVRNHLFLVYPHNIVLLNLKLMQTVAHLLFDFSASSIVCIAPCSFRDAFYLFQENGAVTLRIRRFKGKVPTRNSLDTGQPLEVTYDALCCSENQRMTKRNRVFCGCISSATQTSAVVVTSSGKAYRYNVLPTERSARDMRFANLDRMINVNEIFFQEAAFPLSLSLVNCFFGLGCEPTVIRCNSLEKSLGRLFVAVGTSDGLVQLVDFYSGEIEREFCIHSCPLSCIEWNGAFQMVTCGHTQVFSCSSMVHNEIFLVDVRSGFRKVVRPECDESPVELLRVSHFHSYLAVAFRNQPMEIWDLVSMRLLRKMSRKCPLIVDMAWSTKHNQVRRNSDVVLAKGDQKNTDAESLMQADSDRLIYRENLVVLDHGSNLWHVLVKGMHVRDGRGVKTPWMIGTVVTCMAWKDDTFVFGDEDGYLMVWQIEAGFTKVPTDSQKSAIKRLQFSRVSNDFTLLLLSSTGLGLWNIATLQCLSQLPGAGVGFKCLSVDMASNERSPVLLCSDGCLRIYDPSFSPASITSPYDDDLPNELYFSLNHGMSLMLLKLLLRDRNALNVSLASFDQKGALMPAAVVVLTDDDSAEAENNATSASSAVPTAVISKDRLQAMIAALNVQESYKISVMKCLGSIDDDCLCEILSCDCLIERCLLCGLLFNNEWEISFWNAVQYVLRKDADRSKAQRDEESEESESDDSDASSAVKSASNGDAFSHISLPSFCDLLLPNDSFRFLQLCQCATFDYRTASGGQRHKYIQTLVLLRLFDAAVQLLLETDRTQSDYFSDCLKACLLSASRSSAECQSMVKLVATNLIANGSLSDGIQLLCMIDKYQEACRYLQSFGNWDDSVWLAKVSLGKEDATEIMLKWVDFLCCYDNNQKRLAALVLLGLGHWKRMLEILLAIKQVSMAAMVIEAGTRNGVADICSLPTMFKKHVFKEYADLLRHCGLYAAADFYGKKLDIPAEES